MLNLYCYSEKIIYQTDKESDFEAYKLQAQIEGLKTVESEYFPFEVNETGIIKLDSENNPLPISAKKKIEIGISDLETEKKRIEILIIDNFEKSFNEIKTKYSDSEREGWSFLVSESDSFLKDFDFEKIPSLHAETNFTTDKNVVVQTAKKILQNSYNYKKFLGQMKFLKSSRIEKLENAKTINEILEIEKDLR